MEILWAASRWVAILAILLGGLLLRANPAGAYEPNKDYWFVETLTVGDVDLPDGVVISTSDPSTTPRGYLLLKNHTDTLLFALSLEYQDVLVMQTPDPNWKARVNGAHEVASYLVAPGRPAVLEMDALSDLDHDLIDQNVLDYAPPEENVPIPSPQSSELLLVYGEQVIEVPFTISYSINAQFDNGIEANQQWMARAESTINATFKATQQAEEAAAKAEANKLTGLGLIVLIGILITVGLVWRVVARSKERSIHG